MGEARTPLIKMSYRWSPRPSSTTEVEIAGEASIEEVHAMFAPSDKSAQAVRAWLADAGIDGDHIAEATSKQWLGFGIPARDAERILGTEYFEYTDDTGGIRLGCDK